MEQAVQRWSVLKMKRLLPDRSVPLYPPDCDELIEGDGLPMLSCSIEPADVPVSEVFHEDDRRAS